MLKNIKNLPRWINIIFFIIALYYNLSIVPSGREVKDFSDTHDYIQQSKLDFFSSEFFFPDSDKFAERPFTVPLFYKLCNANPKVILAAQKVIHSIASFLLVASLLLFVRKRALQYTLILMVYILMSWWNILGWSNLMLSESLSMSLFFIWISSLLWLLKRKDKLSIIFHVFCVILFSFTRDSWPYFLLIIYVMLGISSFKYAKALRWRFLGMVLVTVLIFFIQQQSANIGHRYRLPILNNIVVKILPSEEYTKWFVEEGMPLSEELKLNFSNSTDENRKIYSLYHDSTYQELFNWVDTKGKNAYMKFLLTHPRFSLLLDENQEEFDRIFAFNLNYYTVHIQGYSRLALNILPFFKTWHLFVLVILMVACFIRSRRFIFLIPLVFTVACYFNAFLLYNADALEVERHLFITQIFMEVIGLFSLFLYFDSDFFAAKMDIVKSRIRRNN